MKKKIVALVLGAMMSFSAMAMAATPEAELMSAQQAKASAWIDAMLVKNKPADAFKVMSSEAQKGVTTQQIAAIGKDIQKLGKMKGGRFVSWAIPNPKQCQMMYFISFEKAPLVRCVFIFDDKDNLQNFALQPIQPDKKQAPDKAAGKDKTKK